MHLGFRIVGVFRVLDSGELEDGAATDRPNEDQLHRAGPLVPHPGSRKQLCRVSVLPAPLGKAGPRPLPHIGCRCHDMAAPLEHPAIFKQP